MQVITRIQAGHGCDCRTEGIYIRDVCVAVRTRRVQTALKALQEKQLVTIDRFWQE